MGRGAALARDLYEAAVRPLLDDAFPGLEHMAARLGSGSDVIGVDDGTSTDHDFGCRLTLLVDDSASATLPEIDQVLQARLPETVQGWPTRFPTTWDEHHHHRVEVDTVHGFAQSRLGFDTRSPLTPAEWLCLTGQSILEVAGGPVFHDTTSAFGPLSEQLQWYPEDLWLYCLAAGWTRLAQELPLVGRTGSRADSTGSSVIAARLVRDVIHLGFLVERTWIPYPKWAGTVLPTQPVGAVIAGPLASSLQAETWEERQHHLGRALAALARRQGEVGLPVGGPVTQQFFDRPYLVVSQQVAVALTSRIHDADIRALPLIGSIEQWSDSVDLLARPPRRALATALYPLPAASSGGDG